MDVAAGSDLRLGFLLLLNAVVGVSAWRFVAKVVEGDWVDRLADVVLLFYVVQYVSVCGPGVVGVLGPVTMAGVAVGLCVGLWVCGEVWGKKDEKGPGIAIPGLGQWGRVGWVPGVCLAFVVGYLGALVVYYRHLPVISNDALTYHFPVAARWLASGRLGVFETWFFNPANAYSPLAGSAFIAWLMGPVGNDLVASFVQVPALVGVWVVVVRLGREVGLSAAVAAVVGTVVVVSQPFVRASVLSKDDLFVAMFFIAAVAGVSRRLAADRVGAWRVGVAVGLMVAVKYTALMMVPVLAIGGDGVVRAWGKGNGSQASRLNGVRWGRWVVLVGCVGVLAGPWFLRNWVEFGNPLFPVRVLGMPGVLEMGVSERLRSAGGIWRVFTGVDDAMPAVLLGAMVVGWVGWVVAEWREVWGEPVRRVVGVGPVVGVGLFLWKAPYGEIRFLYPVFALLAVGMGAGVVTIWERIGGGKMVRGADPTGDPRAEALGLAKGGAWVVLGAVLVYAALTGLPIQHGVRLLPVGVMAAVVVGGAMVVVRRVRLDWTHGLVAGVVVAVVVAGGIYVYWPAYVRQSAELVVPVWGEKYGGELAGAWGFVRRLPVREKVAYANTFLVYPLMGFEPVREVEYVPVRRGVRRLADLPDMGRVSGEEMVVRVAEVADAEADEGEWLEKIGESGARYLFVEKRAGVPAAPELSMADHNPGRFRVVFDNAAARVYEIR